MKKNLLLTDVDGTLTKKSIVLSHAGYLIEKGLINDDGSYQAWIDDMKNEKLIVAVAENYRHEIVGLTVEQMQAEKFISEFLENEENWYSTLGKLKELKEKENFEVYLITGSSDFLIKELAKKLDVNFFATTYELENNKFTGNIKGMFSEEQKSECITKNIVLSDYHYIIGMGDTVSDNGIFKHSDFKLLVDPTQETLEKLITVQTIDYITKE